MKQHLRSLILGLAVSAMLPPAFALDLPVKRINGKDYYYYAVQRKESLLDIAGKLGVTRQQILEYNPAASDGVRTGMNLYFPLKAFKNHPPQTETSTPAAHTQQYKVQSGETLFGIAYRFNTTPDAIVALNPHANAGVSAGDILLIPSQELPSTTTTTDPDPESQSEPLQQPLADEPLPTAADPIDSVASPAPAKASVAVLMPFMLGNHEQDKTARAATDFIRGFLLGVKSLSHSATPIDLRIYDTNASSDAIHRILHTPALDSVSLVIAPEDILSLPVVLSDARPKDAYVLNLFAAQDTSYIHNPKSIQTYIPASLMYEKAARSIIHDYDGYTPVFLISKGGRSEKLPFTKYLREQYALTGIEPIEIMYDGVLTTDNIAQLDRTGRYVIIPASGSLSEFNKFAKTVATLREEVISPSDVVLFGYPDWTAFLGDAQDKLHDLGAVIYSRFYSDPTAPELEAFNTEFSAIYGTKPQELLPSQALLGYDSARYITDNITRNNGVFTPGDGNSYRGLQTTFMFPSATTTATQGPVNEALYIIHFMPGKQVSVKVL